MSAKDYSYWFWNLINKRRDLEAKFATAEHPAAVADFDELRAMGEGFDLLVEINKLKEAGYWHLAGGQEEEILIVLSEEGEKLVALANLSRVYGDVLEDEIDSD